MLESTGVTVGIATVTVSVSLRVNPSAESTVAVRLATPFATAVTASVMPSGLGTLVAMDELSMTNVTGGMTKSAGIGLPNWSNPSTEAVVTCPAEVSVTGPCTAMMESPLGESSVKAMMILEIRGTRPSRVLSIFRRMWVNSSFWFSIRSRSSMMRFS